MNGAIDRLNAALEGRYRVGTVLGEGGMATVYVARDLRHERDVAIKVLKQELAAMIGGDRFLSEIRTTANLQHPHILPLFDSGESDGFLYYVMPHVEGDSLRRKLDRERQLGVEESVDIALKVADALGYAHRHDVVHRDIKPENILLHDGNPVVADFGIALALSAAREGRLTETGISLGTPHYMSPEQATADRDLSPKSDVYSLGCVLYEMLAGNPPHTGPSAQVVLMRILTEEPRPITDLRRSVPLNVSSVLAKALEKLPADRFENAAAFQAALGDENFTYQPATRPEPALRVVPVGEELSISGRLLSWIRNPISMFAVAAMLILAARGLAGRAADPDPLPVRLRLDLGEIDPNPQSDVIVSPDGSLFAVAGTLGGRSGLFIRNADEERFRLVPGTEGAWYPAFSPTGEWIVYRNVEEDELLKVSVQGGAPLSVLPNGPVSNALFPHWGDDGSIIFIGPDGIYRVPESGSNIPTLLLSRSDVGFPQLLPGGSAVLATDRRNDSIILLHIQSGQVDTLVSEGIDASFVGTGHILYAHPNGGLFALSFDLGRMVVTGQPVPVLGDISVWAGRARLSVSRNGTLVYAAGGGQTEEAPMVHLVIADMVGGIETFPLTPGDLGDPRWSPDGNSIAFVKDEPAGSHIYTYDVVVGAIPRQLTFEGYNWAPAWSPDGTRIAFNSIRGGTETMLFVKSVIDDSPEYGIIPDATSVSLRQWPLEELLVFERSAGGKSSLWMGTPTSEGEAATYLETVANLDDIAVSPDGRWAAYQSDETGTEEVYVRSFPVPRQQIAVSRGGGQYPRWSPDGETLYFWRHEDAAVDTLLAARVRTDPTFIVLTVRPVLVGNYGVQHWDLHPDGDRIVVAQLVSAAGAADGPGTELLRERYLVVVNWFEELKARLGGGH